MSLGLLKVHVIRCLIFRRLAGSRPGGDRSHPRQDRTGSWLILDRERADREGARWGAFGARRMWGVRRP